MDSYKLTYFNLRGVVEPIRLLLKYVNVPFEDYHIDYLKWPQEKKNIKWQQLPFLEYNGLTLTQTSAIMGFLGKKFNLSPNDPWDEAKCEEIIGAVNDLRLTVKPIIVARLFGSSDTQQVTALRQEVLNSTVPLFLTNLSEILQDIHKARNHRSDFILGDDKPTPADFWLAHFTDQWTTHLGEPQLLEKYEILKKQQIAVYNLPGVKEWVESRSQSI